jgi:hypothetical protein
MTTYRSRKARIKTGSPAAVAVATLALLTASCNSSPPPSLPGFERVQLEEVGWVCGPAANGDEHPDIIAFRATKETLLSPAEIAAVMPFNLSAELEAVEGSQSGTRTGKDGERIHYGRLCLDDLQISGSVSFLAGSLLFDQGTTLSGPAKG